MTVDHVLADARVVRSSTVHQSLHVTWLASRGTTTDVGLIETSITDVFLRDCRVKPRVTRVASEVCGFCPHVILVGGVATYD